MRRRIRIVLITLLISLLFFERCAYNDINIQFDCANSTLAIALEQKSDVSNCRAIDGSITVVATEGLEPYAFNINGGEYQTNNTFSSLGPGTYTIRVKDMNGCWKAIDVSIAAAGSTLAATVQTTVDNQCHSDNGTATVTATGGVPPYQYQIDSHGFSDANIFNDLKEGQHVVVVKDSEECQTTLSVHVAHGNTGISYANDIKDIITTNCAKSGCHGAGTGSRDWTVFGNVKSHAANIKTRTSNRTMPPDAPLSQQEIDVISCWVDDGAMDN
jgi:hypothetical protein